MVKKKSKKRNKLPTISIMAICPLCTSPMEAKTGKYGAFNVCTKRTCGYIPSHKEMKKQAEIRKKVSRIQQKKRKQGLIG